MSRYNKPHEKTTDKIWAITKRMVKERDNFQCQECGKMKRLQVHHKIPRKKSRALELEIDNLITLCYDCHKIADRKCGL